MLNNVEVIENICRESLFLAQFLPWHYLIVLKVLKLIVVVYPAPDSFNVVCDDAIHSKSVLDVSEFFFFLQCPCNDKVASTTQLCVHPKAPEIQQLCTVNKV